MISCQPTALKAVRLQSLVPPNSEKIYIRDLLVKNEVSTLKIGLALIQRAHAKLARVTELDRRKRL